MSHPKASHGAAEEGPRVDATITCLGADLHCIQARQSVLLDASLIQFVADVKRERELEERGRSERERERERGRGREIIILCKPLIADTMQQLQSAISGGTQQQSGQPNDVILSHEVDIMDVN
jgi:hypothetical protein